MPWIFQDFVDSRGDNVIRPWLDSIPLKARLKIDSVLRHLRVQARFSYPVKKIHGYEGVFEIVIESFNVQYRPLGGYGRVVGEFVLVIGAIEQNDRIQPPDAFLTASKRIQTVLDGTGRTCEHDYENKALCAGEEPER